MSRSVAVSRDLFGETTISGTAHVSSCQTYRYYLSRHVSNESQSLNFLMLNPSTADATTPDPTITRCIGFCRSFGYGTLEVTNLYALRSTDPTRLRTHPDPAGPENREWVIKTARNAGLVIVAWGNHGKRNDAGDKMLKALKGVGVIPHRLGPLTKQGQPNHPLYLKSTLMPEPLW